MPEAGQGALPAQLTALMRAILSHVDSQRLRLVYVSEDGYHPRDSYHRILKERHDPQRPWCPLTWRRMVDYSHACLYIQERAEALFGSTPTGRAWAQQRRQHLKTRADGIPRVLQSATALRRQRGVWGKPKGSAHADAYLKKRTHGMRYRHDSSQYLPIGSGITEAACKMVFTQRLKRSGMSWTIEGGHVILDVRVIWLRGVWDAVHARYLASQPMPVTQGERVDGAQRGQQVA